MPTAFHPSAQRLRDIVGSRHGGISHGTPLPRVSVVECGSPVPLSRARATLGNRPKTSRTMEGCRHPRRRPSTQFPRFHPSSHNSHASANSPHHLHHIAAATPSDSWTRRSASSPARCPPLLPSIHQSNYRQPQARLASISGAPEGRNDNSPGKIGAAGGQPNRRPGSSPHFSFLLLRLRRRGKGEEAFSFWHVQPPRALPPQHAPENQVRAGRQKQKSPVHIQPEERRVRRQQEHRLDKHRPRHRALKQHRAGNSFSPRQGRVRHRRAPHAAAVRFCAPCASSRLITFL